MNRPGKKRTVTGYEIEAGSVQAKARYNRELESKIHRNRAIMNADIAAMESWASNGFSSAVSFETE